MLCFYHPWECLYFTLDITYLSASMHLVFSPRLICPLMIGESHDTGCMGS